MPGATTCTGRVRSRATEPGAGRPAPILEGHTDVATELVPKTRARKGLRVRLSPPPLTEWKEPGWSRTASANRVHGRSVSRVRIPLLPRKGPASPALGPYFNRRMRVWQTCDEGAIPSGSTHASWPWIRLVTLPRCLRVQGGCDPRQGRHDHHGLVVQ